jgi:ECF sigma factor
LVHGFFARLLQGNFLENVGPQEGKFRSFVVAALNHFLSDEWDKTRGQKRGGGQSLISLDDYHAEELYLAEPNSSARAERIFDQRWAVTLLAQALAQLREESPAAGKTLELG